jgi:hypothetical protein
MTGHQETESPQVTARQIHAAAIIQNIVKLVDPSQDWKLLGVHHRARYYIPDFQSTPVAPYESQAPSSPTLSATSASTGTTAVQDQLELPPGTSKLKQDPTLTALARSYRSLIMRTSSFSQKQHAVYRSRIRRRAFQAMSYLWVLRSCLPRGVYAQILCMSSLPRMISKYSQLSVLD